MDANLREWERLAETLFTGRLFINRRERKDRKEEAEGMDLWALCVLCG
jgi:hypothetical protein